MNQQINLYQPMFRPQRTTLSAMTMAQITGVVIVSLAVLYSYAWWQLTPLRDRSTALSARVPASEQRLVSLRAEYPPPVESPALKRQVREAQEKLAHTREIASNLRSGAYGSITGLSPYLEGFARQHVEGTWLTRVRVRSGGRSIGLDGRALIPDLVPAYIGRLSREKAFQGTSFSNLELSTDARAIEEVTFSVRTRGIQADPES